MPAGASPRLGGVGGAGPSASTPGTPKKAAKNIKSGTATPQRTNNVEQLDLAGLNLRPEDGLNTPTADEPPPKIAMAREKLIEEAKKMLESKDEKKGVSLVVIGRP